MTASNGNSSERQRRFVAGPPKFGMTPDKGQILDYIARLGSLTTRQVVRVTGRGKSGVYKHLADIKNHKLIQPHSAPYSDFAPPSAPNPAVSWAPGENIYVATKLGIKWLLDAGYIDSEADVPIPTVPARGYFMAHQMLIQDVRVWVELCLRASGGTLLKWVEGDAAHFSTVRPDAWFLYRLRPDLTLLGMVEADRKTERGYTLKAKAEGYQRLLGSDELAKRTDGRRNFRLLAVTIDEHRRNRIATDMALPGIADRVYAATVDDIATGGLAQPIWQTPGSPNLVPLVPESVLSPS